MPFGLYPTMSTLQISTCITLLKNPHNPFKNPLGSLSHLGVVTVMSTEAVGGDWGLTVRSVWKLVWWIDPDGGSNATVRMPAAIKPQRTRRRRQHQQDTSIQFMFFVYRSMCLCVHARSFPKRTSHNSFKNSVRSYVCAHKQGGEICINYGKSIKVDVYGVRACFFAMNVLHTYAYLSF